MFSGNDPVAIAWLTNWTATNWVLAGAGVLVCLVLLAMCLEIPGWIDHQTESLVLLLAPVVASIAAVPFLGWLVHAMMRHLPEEKWSAALAAVVLAVAMAVTVRNFLSLDHLSTLMKCLPGLAIFIVVVLGLADDGFQRAAASVPMSAKALGVLVVVAVIIAAGYALTDRR